ncbi:hypothetical protein DOTSEDRAFT_73398, partial [Dothistroma septosporum NZE10]
MHLGPGECGREHEVRWSYLAHGLCVPSRLRGHLAFASRPHHESNPQHQHRAAPNRAAARRLAARPARIESTHDERVASSASPLRTTSAHCSHFLLQGGPELWLLRPVVLCTYRQPHLLQSFTQLRSYLHIHAHMPIRAASSCHCKALARHRRLGTATHSPRMHIYAGSRRQNAAYFTDWLSPHGLVRTYLMISSTVSLRDDVVFLCS